jgi:hypothetical protein
MRNYYNLRLRIKNFKLRSDNNRYQAVLKNLYSNMFEAMNKLWDGVQITWFALKPFERKKLVISKGSFWSAIGGGMTFEGLLKNIEAKTFYRWRKYLK